MRTLTAIIAAALAAAALAPAGAAAGPRHCPPGHQMKGWCGNGGGGGDGAAYREGYRDGLRAGAYVERERYVIIDDWSSRGYRAPDPGYGYVRVDNDVFLVLLGTGLIIEALSN